MLAPIAVCRAQALRGVQPKAAAVGPKQLREEGSLADFKSDLPLKQDARLDGAR